MSIPSLPAASEWATTPELALEIKSSVSYLTKLRTYGGPDALPFSKIGRKVVYHVPTIRQILASRMRRTTSDVLPEQPSDIPPDQPSA